jgi:cytochrome b pre-mRNA-processing protein 3
MLLPPKFNKGKRMIFKKLFSKKPSPAETLYAAIVAAARQPHFYADLEVPDTVDGRFDMIVLHVFLVLERLKKEAPSLCQQITDLFFDDMDSSLREMGVGDLSVGKKVRKMAEAFHGRLNAYALAMEQGEQTLIEALQRNVYGGQTTYSVMVLAKWVKDAKASLASQSTEDIVAAKVRFA